MCLGERNLLVVRRYDLDVDHHRNLRVLVRPDPGQRFLNEFPSVHVVPVHTCRLDVQQDFRRNPHDLLIEDDRIPVLLSGQVIEDVSG